MGKQQQPTQPRLAPRIFDRVPCWDNHPHAEIYRQLHILGEREETTLTALEAAEWDDDVDDGEYTFLETALDNIVDLALQYHKVEIAPLYRQWWTA
jgi:hypothetical protein